MTAILTPDELSTYERQLAIPGWGVAGQMRLKQATVFVAGAGGLGAPVLYALAGAGVGRILVCDSDRIESSNLNRQFLHNHARIGMPKAESACASMAALNPAIAAIPLCTRIERTNAQSLAGSADLIVDCLDNFTTRHHLNKAALDLGIPYVHGGVAEFRGQATFIHAPRTACLACFMPPGDRSRKKIAVAGATPGVIGSLQAVEALKYLTGIGPALANRLLFWDGLTMRFETITLSRNPRCRVCRHLG